MNRIRQSLDAKKAARPVDISDSYYTKDQVDKLLSEVSGGPGSTAWGGITGTLSSQTDLQTALDAKQAAGSYANAVHTHSQSDVTGLVTALAGKAASTHTHAQSDVTNLVTDLAGKASATHTHAQSDITNLTTDLAAKAATGSTNNFASPQNIGNGSGIATVNVNGGSGSLRSYRLQTNSVDRWHILADSTAESGSNAGSNLIIRAFDDAGGTIGSVITANRATQLVTVPSLATGLTGLLKGNGASAVTAAVAGTDFAAASHTHAQSDITNLTTDLAAKAAGAASSVDNEIVLFSGTGGKTLKRASNTGMLKASAGVIATATDGTDYYSSAYAIPNANIPNGINNGSQAAQSQVVVSGTAYYITRSNLALPASSKTGGGMSVGTRFLWRVGLTKTAAGTGTFQLRIYRGTNGSTADTADVTQTLGTQTAAVDNMTVDVMVTVTATGATGSYYWTIIPNNKAVTATGFGIATGTGAYFSGTVSSVALNTASLQLGLGFISNTGTPTITIPFVHGQVFNMT